MDQLRFVISLPQRRNTRPNISGFVGGGGRWLIEAVKPNKSDFWEANWKVGDRDDPDQNIWHVKYGRILRNANQPEQPLPAAKEVKEHLKEVLSRISAFAHKNDCGNFGECFDRGISALTNLPSSTDKGYKYILENYATPGASSAYKRLPSLGSLAAWAYGMIWV